MFCESYRKALSEAAASAETLPGEITAHLAACDGCRTAFLERRALLSSIDGALRTAANSEVPASLVPRVRAQVSSSSPGTVWRKPVLALAMALLVVGLAALSASSVWRAPSHRSKGMEPALIPTVPAVLKDQPTESPIRTAAQPFGRATRQAGEKAVVALQVPGHSEPEVLVSPEEAAGLQRYTAVLRARTVEPSAGVAVKSDAAFEIEPLEIAVMDLRQLTIEPLASAESN